MRKHVYLFPMKEKGKKKKNMKKKLKLRNHLTDQV